MVSNHVMDLIERYGEDSEIPKDLTDYVKARKFYDYKDHSREGAAHGEFVTDEIADRFSVIGSVDAVREKLRELDSIGVDHFNIYLMTHGQEEILEDLRRLDHPGAGPSDRVMAPIHEHLFDVEAAKRRLQEGKGGYEIVHSSPGLEVGVYVLVAPEPDRQQPHEDDEVYVVLEGRGTLQVEDEESRPRGGPGDVRGRRRGAPVHRLRAAEPPRDLHASALATGSNCVLASLPTTSTGAGRGADEGVGDAPEDQLADRAPASRADDDQVVAALLGDARDLRRRIAVLHLHLGRDPALAEVRVRPRHVLVGVRPHHHVPAGLRAARVGRHDAQDRHLGVLGRAELGDARKRVRAVLESVIAQQNLHLALLFPAGSGSCEPPYIGESPEAGCGLSAARDAYD